MTVQVASQPDINANTNDALLRVEELEVCFRQGGRRLLPVIRKASLTLRANEALGIVGESGSGKTMLCRSLIGTLARHGAVITGGKILFENADLARAGEQKWRTIRGRRIGYVPQSSLAGLNPVLTIGDQLIEAIVAVKPVSRQAAAQRALELLDMVRIPRGKAMLRQRAHQLSGGMRQRVMIATAIAQQPRILIADEPTTALDVTIQREILTLLNALRQQLGMALILISHDLSVIEMMCDSLMVMYAGASVESGTVEALTTRARHPYTLALRKSRVDRGTPGVDLETIPGEPLSVGAWPPGCRFAPRCAYAIDACRQGAQPPLAPTAEQLSACIRAEELDEADERLSS